MTCDGEGLALLIDELEWLASHNGPDHFQLFTESWGGGDLSEEPLTQDGGFNFIHHCGADSCRSNRE